MIARETIALGRGIMIATHQGGTLTVTAIIAGEAVVIVAAGAEVGVKTVLETATERGTGIGIETEIEAGAGPSAELDPEAGVEVRNSLA